MAFQAFAFDRASLFFSPAACLEGRGLPWRTFVAGRNLVDMVSNGYGTYSAVKNSPLVGAVFSKKRTCSLRGAPEKGITTL